MRVPRLEHGGAMPDILITEETHDPSIGLLTARFEVDYAPSLWRDPPRLRERLATVRAAIVRNMTQVDRAFLDAAPRLEVVGRIGVGLDTIDVPALTERGVVLCYPPEANAVTVAEHTFAVLLSLARKLREADRSVRAGDWDRHGHVGFELHGKTMGIVGLGRIGFRVATRARAFGMRVLAYDPWLTPQHPAVTESGAALVPFERLLAEADVVTCHVPLTAATRGMMNADTLRRMMRGAVLINTSRGPVVETAALVDALASGYLTAAALDVFEEEPPVGSPLLALPNLLLTPHVAGWTRESLQRMISTVAEDVARVLDGQPALSYANFPLPHEPGAR